MPPVVTAIGAIVSTVLGGITTLGVSLGLSKGLAILVGKAVLGFIANAAMSALARALSPEPSGIDQGYNLKLKFDATYPREIVVGRAAVAGSMVYATVSGDDNKYLWRVNALSDCEIDSCESVQGNGKTLTFTGDLHTGLRPCSSHFKDKDGNACLYIRIYKGTTSQTANSDLVSASGGEWTSNCRGRGVAYAITRMTYDADAFSAGEPELIYVIKGALIHDPRDDSTAWSENAALIAGQYAKGFYTNGVRVVGLGMSDADVPEAELSDAADICDIDMALAAGGTEKQYCIGGVISGMEPPRGALSDMVLAMGGLHIDRGGEIVFLPGAARTPVHSFGRALIDDDLLSDETITYTPDRPADDLCNTVHSTFVSPTKKWQESPLPVRKDASAIAADNAQRFAKVRRYRLVTSSTRGQRLDKRFLAEQRYQGRVSFGAGMWALEYEPGDWEEWDSQRWGGGTKTWLIETIAFQIDNGALEGEATARVRIGAREIGDLVDDWDTGDEADASGVIPTRPEPSLTLSGLSVSAVAVNRGGAVMPELRIAWSAVTHPAATIVELEYRTQSDSTVRYRTGADPSDTAAAVRQGVFPRQTYEVRGRVRTVDRVGAWTSWTAHSGKTTNVATNALAFEYAASGSIEIGQGYAKRIDGPAAWDAQVYSIDGITGPCHAAGVAAANDKALMFGLNTDPTTNASYNSLDFAWYLKADGNAEIWESNALVLTVGTYAAGDSFSISFNGSTIRYYQNGHMIYSTFVSVTTALFFDSSFNSVDARLNRIQFRTGALASEVFEFAANYSNRIVVNEGNARKVSGPDNSYNAQIYSLVGFAGGAHCSASPAQTNGGIYFGLNSDPTTNAAETSLDYAWRCRTSGAAHIEESGVDAGEFVASYSAGDIFGVSYDGAEIVYTYNGREMRRVRVRITARLYFDSSFYNIGAQLDAIKFARGPAAVNAAIPFEWNATGGLAVTRGAGVKVGSTAAWDAQLYSIVGHKGGAHCSASPAQSNAACAFGLNTDPTTDANYTSIDFGFRFTTGAQFYVVEGGTDKTVAASYSAGDTFTIAFDRRTVRYFMNGDQVWSSRSTTTSKLYFDSAFYTQDARLENISFGKGGAGAINLVGPGQINTAEFANLVTDPHFEDTVGGGAFWNLPAEISLNAPSPSMNVPRSLNASLVGVASGGSVEAYVNEDFWAVVEPDMWYRFRALTRTTNGFTGRASVRVEWYDQAKTTISSDRINGLDYKTVAKSGTSNAFIANIKKSPSTARFARFRLRVDASTTLTNAGSCFWAAPVMQKYQFAGGWGALTSLGGYISTATPLSAADVGATATITVANFSVELPDANGAPRTVSFTGGTITGRAFSTVYHIFAFDPGQDGGAVTYSSSTSVQTYASDVNYFYIGSVTTPADGAGGTTGGGVGGGRDCVAADAFVDECRRASEVRIGSLIDLMNYDGRGFGPGLVDGAERSPQPCVRLTSASGVQLTCSLSTPITQPPMRDEDGIIRERTVLAGDAYGALVSVHDEEGFRWEEITGHEFVGVRDVMHIHAGGGTFAAGDQPGRYMFTHNVVKP